MMFFLQRGFRVIAHDRRGHGRSSQTAFGNEMDTYVADVNELTVALDLRDAIPVMHGEDDQVVPFATMGARSAQIVKGAVLKSYPGLPHGMPTTHADTINADLLAFVAG